MRPPVQDRQMTRVGIGRATFTLMNKLRLALNAVTLFVSASILEMTLHEGGHFLAGILMHMQPVLHHNYVSSASDGDTPNAGIWFAAAGPVASLLLGIITLLVLRTGRPQGFTRLFLWYFSVSGFIGFWGYLMIAPFFSYGDTGYILRALNCPMWLIVLLAVVGLAMLAVSVRLLAPFAVSLMNTQTSGDKAERKKFVFGITELTLYIGIPIIALLNLPTPTFLSILAPLMSPWSLLYAYGYYLKGKPYDGMYDEGERIRGKMPVIWFVLLGIAVIVNRLLVMGFAG